ncbi:MAG: TetR/AcrR family transcriptional regulator [Acidimicrobiales bacterium]|nr:TetR/AcrR family transcriptional regulator [Acidimicrobiales bacterium]MCB9393777.1 TetR/AcrR family transcriptional regulator [Acidimicrobiaceae bacterium]
MAARRSSSRDEHSSTTHADPARDRILAAALDLFSERSFDGATTRAIAERAGVTQPLLNYHFSSKDELWRAAVDGLFEALGESLRGRQEGLRGVDEPTTARLMIREFIWFSARNPQLHRIITQECKFDGPRMDHLVEHHIRPLYERTVSLLRSLSERGVIARIPAEHLYYVITGAGPSMFVLGPECRRLTGLEPTDDAVIEAHVEAVCTLIFGS